MKTKSNSKYLRISVTNNCNLGCYFCHNEGQSKLGCDSISADDIIYISGIAKENGYTKFKLTGGEPTLNPNLVKIVKGISNFGVTDVSIITNAIRLENLAIPLKIAGLNRINVSLFTLDASSFSKNNNGDKQQLQKVVCGIKAALANGYTDMKLNYIWHNNEEDFRQICNFALENKLMLVVLPLLAESNNLNQHKVLKEEINRNISLIGEIASEENIVDKEGLSNVIYSFRSGLKVMFKLDELGLNKPFNICKSCKRKEFCRESIFPIRLSHDGKLIPCLSRRDNWIDIYNAIQNRDTALINNAFEKIEFL